MSVATDDRSAELHHEHRDVTGGRSRSAVFGVMDGLVSNFVLVAGGEVLGSASSSWPGTAVATSPSVRLIGEMS